jgi:hypothetical protein
MHFSNPIHFFLYFLLYRWIFIVDVNCNCLLAMIRRSSLIWFLVETTNFFHRFGTTYPSRPRLITILHFICTLVHKLAWPWVKDPGTSYRKKSIWWTSENVVFGICYFYSPIHLRLKMFCSQRRRKIDNWGGGAIFIYLCSQTLKTIDFKRNE